MKYQSITTPEVQHDVPNMLTELVLLNAGKILEPYPWRGEHKSFWTKTVPVMRKLLKSYGLCADQLAFYIYRCSPTEIDSAEFAKAAVVAKKLFRPFPLQQLIDIYRQRAADAAPSVLESVSYKPVVRIKKSLVDFLKELENG